MANRTENETESVDSKTDSSKSENLDKSPGAKFPLFPEIPTSSPGNHFTSLLTVPPGEMGDTNGHMELLQV